MKKIFLFVGACTLVFSLSAQNTIWKYDFGTAASASPYTSSTYANNGTVVPPTSTGNTGAAGVAGVKVGSSDGSVTLTTNGLAGGTGAELQMIGAITAGTKFGIANYAGTTVGAFQCNFSINTTTSGRYLLYLGNGTNFSNGNGFNGSQTFANLNINYGGGTSTAAINWYNGTGYVSTGMTQTTVTRSAAHTVIFFMNNSMASTSYDNSNGMTGTLAAGTYDIWMDGTKILTGATTTGLAANTAITSMNLLYIAAGTTGATPTINVDNILYSNYLPSGYALPITLTSFTGANTGNAVTLNWQTASEINNAQFDILRSTDGLSFSQIGTVKGNGNTQQMSYYSYTDENPLLGNSYYQLKQVDFSGNNTLSKIIQINRTGQNNNTLQAWHAGANNIEIKMMANVAGKGVVNIYNLSGELIIQKQISLSQGTNEVEIPTSITKGIYFAVLTMGNQKLKTKFIY